jgi:hypothetical protein
MILTEQETFAMSKGMYQCEVLQQEQGFGIIVEEQRE